MRLSSDYYLQPDIVAIAENLVGKILVTHLDGKLCRGFITETEAYAGITDRASHAYEGRHTPRTQTMFQQGGIAYIYLCYGIHHLFNVVTNVEGIPHAALIRAIEPIEGIEYMLNRRKAQQLTPNLTNGPGKVSAAMGINTSLSGYSLNGPQIWIEDSGITIPPQKLIRSPRVGVGYAKDDALLPYRFRIKDNKWTSPAP